MDHAASRIYAFGVGVELEVTSVPVSCTPKYADVRSRWVWNENGTRAKLRSRTNWLANTLLIIEGADPSVVASSFFKVWACLVGGGQCQGAGGNG